MPSPTSLGKRKKSDADLDPEPSTEDPKRSHTGVISTEKKRINDTSFFTNHSCTIKK
jgi:hypothetical protein